ncbi:hypothetical protein HY988_03480 [Candidatus Micrarchaeota archaeon]|nr:hypothetical protein [Candidatus Micrarchaeota archaeon]
MMIVCKGPIRAKDRDHFLKCPTDESIVARLTARLPYNGLVERTQPIAAFGPDQIFKVDEYSVFSPSRVYYHILRYLALDFAHSVLPDNFVAVRELRFFERYPRKFAAMYSDFVPDETGVAGRRREAMRRYYAETNADAAKKILHQADELEQIRNPDLMAFTSVTRNAGIMVPHAEANYHHRAIGGELKTVFFEVGRINSMSAYHRACKKDETLINFATFYAAVIKCWAYGGDYGKKGAGFKEIDFDELFYMVYKIFRETEKATNLIGQNYEAIRSGLSLWMSLADHGVPQASINPSCKIDEKVFRF